MAYTLGELYGDILLDYPTLYVMENRRYDIVEQLEQEGRDIKKIFSEWFVALYKRYKLVKRRSMDRAQKKIYFWIIPRLYDTRYESGRRLAEKNYQRFLDFFV